MKKYIVIATALLLLAGSVTTGVLLRQDQQNDGTIRGAVVKPAVFLDVRTDQEWLEGHLDGAIHLDLDNLKRGILPELAMDTEIKIYCRTGNRAGQALQILQQNGFSNVSNAGGLTDLQAQGKKVCIGAPTSCN